VGAFTALFKQVAQLPRDSTGGGPITLVVRLYGNALVCCCGVSKKRHLNEEL
jgi:hypothetical protein